MPESAGVTRLAEPGRSSGKRTKAKQASAPPDPFLRSLSLDRTKVTSADDFPWCLPAVRSLKSLKFHPKVTFFIGENGTGKSTLLEAIAACARFGEQGGTKNFNRSDTE
jgi:predicted ATPase